jgi:hypothetical protein
MCGCDWLWIVLLTAFALLFIARTVILGFILYYLVKHLKGN